MSAPKEENLGLDWLDKLVEQSKREPIFEGPHVAFVHQDLWDLPALMIYVGDWGYNATRRTGIIQCGADLPNSAHDSHAPAIQGPESVGLVSKPIPTPDATFYRKCIHIFAKPRSNASRTFYSVRASTERGE